MRYTHKLDKPDGNCNYFLIPDQEQCDAAENKLGRFEDIEEAFAECGVDIFEHLNNSLKVVKKYKSAIPFWLIPPTYFDEIIEKYKALYSSNIIITRLEDK